MLMTMSMLLKMPKSFATLSDEEKRVFPRKEVHADVEANRTDHSIMAHREPTVRMALRDLSLGGMSAISPTPLSSGEKLTVFFPPLGSHGGWDAVGRVIRCSPSAMGYRVAVEFDPVAMAA
jgi:hypothetical protein